LPGVQILHPEDSMMDKPKPPDDREIGDLPRRSFMTSAVAFLVGAIAGLAPLAAAVVYFLDPVTRRKKAVGATGAAVDADGFIRITTREALPQDGTPRAFKVIADLQDYWNKFPDAEIGSVFLSQDAQGQITCFNTRCPHLGCTVGYDDKEQRYFCPCHESAFSLDGKRSNDIPPRDMDRLECHEEADGTIRVRYVKYRAGIKEQKPI
jgi:menaquinol-cytochrome c reductase iron-sulfur subunit